MLAIILFIFLINTIKATETTNIKSIKIWGPGLNYAIRTPIRYFFIDASNASNIIFNENNEIKQNFDINIRDNLNSKKSCKVWINIFDRKDGTLIVRYKTYNICNNLQIVVKIKDQHVGDSPYLINNKIYGEDCNCPNVNLNQFLNSWECGEVPQQIINDLSPFTIISWKSIRQKLIKNFDKPHSISFCHYIINNNEIFRKCYGKYVGFKMFVDSMLLSLSQKINLPNLEFFVNLGDWPLASKQNDNKFPIFSWCGSTETYDIVMPTYDITESTLEMMNRVVLDVLSVQGNVQFIWDKRTPKAFWRGRDSNRHRLNLIDISRKHPDLINASLTNFFFFRDEEEKYGPKVEYTSFFNFFDYKYQIAIDGTVASYRVPYLLGGASLVFKHDSHYYEHFYNELKPYIHYIPVKKDLSNLIEKLLWAKNNDNKAKEIAKNGQNFVNTHLLPQHIYCYHAHLLNEYYKRIKKDNDDNIVDLLNDMEQIKKSSNCNCDKLIKDEL